MLKKLLLLIVPILIAWAPTTTDVTAAWTTVCIADREGKSANIQFKVHNTGANPLTNCRVQTWVGPASTDWLDISTTWSACISLAAGGKTAWEIMGSSHEILRVQAQSTAGTTIYCRPYGN